MSRQAACRIICIGNRFVRGDDIGPKVYDRLLLRRLPQHVELIEGGIAGLNLLQHAEGVRRIIFVDAVSGFDTDDGLVNLGAQEIVAGAESHFGHSAGLPYLLRSMPAALDGPVPEVILLGADAAASDRTIDALADACLRAATADRGGQDGRTHQTA
jgi:hydrogenase maturation protease